MRTPIETLSWAVAAGNISILRQSLATPGLLEEAGLENRLRIMSTAIHRDNPRMLAMLDRAGWLDGYAGDLHPLAIAVGRRKTQAVEYLLENARYDNHDLVAALACSVERAGEQVDRRRERIHKMLWVRLQRKPHPCSPWHRLLATLLGRESGWLEAAQEGITPHLFDQAQHAAFLVLWPQERQEPDPRVSRWLLEEGLDPDMAAAQAPFWRRLAAPFLAKRLEERLEVVTAAASGESRRRGRL